MTLRNLPHAQVHSKVPDDEVGGKKGKGGAGGGTAGFEGVAALFPPCLFDDGRPGARVHFFCVFEV